jgi:predicted glycogen debranching enzyme
MHEHGAMVQRITLRSGAVEIQPVSRLPPVVFGHSGVFVGSPDWWRRFEYLDDRERTPDFQEDLWTPGVFEIPLEPGVTQYLQVAVGALPGPLPKEQIAEAAAFVRAQDPGEPRPPCVRVLSVAAEQFCADAREQPLVISGYPFYDLRTRDLAISLPGLYLCRGRVEEAKRALSTLVASVHAGLLPRDLERARPRERRPAPDATLWLFEAVRALVDRVGPRDELVAHELYPALSRIFLRVRRRTRKDVWLSPSGLVATGETVEPLTWVDASAGGHSPPARVGLCIELQPLWARGCELLAQLAGEHDHDHLAEAAARAAQAARTAFRARFWCNETRYPFDCISESSDTADAWADPTIRPNAVVALALDPSLFEPWQAVAIVERARHDLVTPRGLRTLSPQDVHYTGHYAGTREERDFIAHRGAAWTFLLGSYVRAALHLGANDPQLVDELRALVTHAADDGPVLGQVAQLAEGDPPHRPRGCPAQAWSVAELLRALVDELGL